MSIPYPVVFAYLMTLAACVALATIVLVIALILAIWPRGRRIARRLAGGAIGALPFLLFFQGLALPVLPAIAAIPFLIGVWSAPPDMPGMIAGVGELALLLAVFLAASVVGIVAGWGVGARIASGTPLRDAMRSSRALTLLAAGLSRLSPVRRTLTPEWGIAVGLGIIAVTVGGLALANKAYVEAYGTAEIDYRGEKIALAKKYVDYDDYKNDPWNLAAAEIPRIERMMTEARIGPDFASWADFVEQAFAIKFPGYGMGGGPNVVAIGREFLVDTIEIPQVGKERYFVLEKRAGGALRLVDDFVAARSRWSAYRAIASVRLVDDRLVYSDRDAKVVRETPIAP